MLHTAAGDSNAVLYNQSWNNQASSNLLPEAKKVKLHSNDSILQKKKKKTSEEKVICQTLTALHSD